jgi:hypothetical protein
MNTVFIRGTRQANREPRGDDQLAEEAETDEFDDDPRSASG